MFRNTLFVALWRPAACVLGLSILVAGLGSPAAAQEENEADRSVLLDNAMEKLAEQVAQYFEAEGEEAAIVGPFTGPPGTSAGPRIVQSLSDKLSPHLNVVKTKACGVSGTYLGQQDEGSGKFVVRVEAVVRNRLGGEMRKLTSHIVTSEQEGLALLGVTADVTGQADPEQRAETIVESIVDPKVAVTGPDPQPPGTIVESGGPPPGNVIRAKPDSPYGIELLVKTPDGFQPLPVVDDGGLATVDIQKGQSYAIRLVNNSPLAAGATVTIDGVNVLSFSEVPSYRALGKWVVFENSQGFVPGWHINGDKFQEFLVTDFGISAAAELQSFEGIGTITVAFCAAFPKGKPPDDEPPPGAIDRGDLGTGRGAVFQRQVKDVQLEYGAVRSVISVRYVKPDLSDAPPPN